MLDPHIAAARCAAVVSAAVLVLVAGCAAPPKEQPVAAPQSGPVGGILLVRDPSQGQGPKVIVASYVFRAGSVQAQPALVAFGAARPPRSDGQDFRVRLVDAAGAALSEAGFFNPRRVVVERQGLVEVPEATYAARFAFDARASQAQVLDAQGNVLASSDVAGAIRAFCAKTQKDPDCARLRG